MASLCSAGAILGAQRESTFSGIAADGLPGLLRGRSTFVADLRLRCRDVPAVSLQRLRLSPVPPVLDFSFFSSGAGCAVRFHAHLIQPAARLRALPAKGSGSAHGLRVGWVCPVRKRIRCAYRRSPYFQPRVAPAPASTCRLTKTIHCNAPIQAVQSLDRFCGYHNFFALRGFLRR
jgi:hypothetical protein